MEKLVFVDNPYVSDFLRATIEENGLPVVKTKIAEELGFQDGPNLIEEVDAVHKALSADQIRIYTSSENSIGWIAEHLSSTGLQEKIDLFKNKVRFRNLTKPMYPDFYFREVRRDDLTTLDVNTLPLPCIIKPAVGFFSLGVYKVTNAGEWEQTVQTIEAELLGAKNLYPTEVLNTESFIIEQCIEGEEFAIDAYYDADGEPVILNILKHLFSSGEDVSDRVYISSKEIIVQNIDRISDFLRQIGKLAGVTSFPVHVEVRREASGRLLPIEINPMRFGGWCTTADMTALAYGFNPYIYFFSHKKPNWAEILSDKGGKLYSIIVLNNASGIKADRIRRFDYDLLLSGFETPLELRQVNFRKYPLFGFLFTETREENVSELDTILKSDLKEFITVDQ